MISVVPEYVTIQIATMDCPYILGWLDKDLPINLPPTILALRASIRSAVSSEPK